jgi:two-component system response regulator NreC
LGHTCDRVTDGKQAIEQATQKTYEAIFMDMHMPVLDGIEATRQIRRIAPRTHVLILSGYVDERQLLDAVRAGAAGFLIKTSDVNELLLAIDSAKRGNRYFSSKLNDNFDVDELLQQSRRPAASTPAEKLTVREREVLQLVAEGYTNQGIADALVVSVKTVEAHKSHLQQKLRARNRADLIRYAISSGLVTLETVDEGFSALGDAEAG